MSVVIGGKYEHYKGKPYRVLAIAKHSETLEEMVVYQALYGEMGIWVRPAAMWNEHQGWLHAFFVYIWFLCEAIFI